jgi:hypothetical protein
MCVFFELRIHTDFTIATKRHSNVVACTPSCTWHLGDLGHDLAETLALGHGNPGKPCDETVMDP